MAIASASASSPSAIPSAPRLFSLSVSSKNGHLVHLYDMKMRLIRAGQLTTFSLCPWIGSLSIIGMPKKNT
ncbi:unnamed protein product [Camellia sinensis]